MRELAQAVQGNAAYYGITHEDDPKLPADQQSLQDAAKAWATASLDTFRDDLLKKALAISAAIADFTAELQKT